MTEVRLLDGQESCLRTVLKKRLPAYRQAGSLTVGKFAFALCDVNENVNFRHSCSYGRRACESWNLCYNWSDRFAKKTVKIPCLPLHSRLALPWNDVNKIE